MKKLNSNQSFYYFQKRQMMNSVISSAIVVVLSLILTLSPFGALYSQQETVKRGVISGKIVDAQSGEPLIGANVYLKENNTLGSPTDIEGNYRILYVPVGTYTLIVGYVSYASMEITEVVVKEGDVTKLDISLEPAVEEMEEIVITASRLKNSEASLLKERQFAFAISDAISSEKISKSGSSDAADAMKKVTGASIVDNKYIFIRGLGERYTNTQFNNAAIPSADPDKKAVQLDLFPASFIDNIVTVKSFTPDKPGDFTGGSVNIETKSFPEQFKVTFSSSTSYNSQSNLKDSFLLDPSGKLGFIPNGLDDRSIPGALADPFVDIPDIGSAWTDPDKAAELDRLSRSFDPKMAPVNGSSPLNQNYQLSIENQASLFGKPLGFLGSLTYARSFKSYNDGRTARWQLTGHVDDTDLLNNDFDLNDNKSTEQVVIGGLFDISVKMTPEHQFKYNFMYNKKMESNARYQYGTFPRDMVPEAVYETRTLQYIERYMNFNQFSGKHYFKNLLDMRFNWNFSVSSSKQDEPDLRFFTNNYTDRERNGTIERVYSIRPSIYPLPTRYFRDLTEDNNNFKADITIPIKKWSRINSNLKFGMSYLDTDHNFRERRFEYKQDKLKYYGDPDDYFKMENVGILEDLSTQYLTRFGHYIANLTTPANNFDGTQEIFASYLMAKLPITYNLSVIGGFRYETTKIDVASHDENLGKGHLDDKDILPSLNLIYQLNDNMNLRAAYSKTLARPTFRELSPYTSFEFVNGYYFVGNEDLKRTLSDNFDIRWEWFERPGEIYAVSLFYKDLENPIEKVIRTINGETEFDNVDEATVMGAEFEFRKKLDFLNTSLERLTIGSNLSFVKSQVDIAEGELAIIKAINPYASGQRELQGQSPFILNIDAEFNNLESTGTIINLDYNVMGKRVSEVSLGGTPNVYEQPFNLMNIRIAQNLFFDIPLKLSIRNILDQSVKHVHEYKGNDFVVKEYKPGRTISLGFEIKY